MRKKIKVIEYEDVIDIISSAISDVDTKIENNQNMQQTSNEFEKNSIFYSGMKTSLSGLLKAFEENR